VFVDSDRSEPERGLQGVDDRLLFEDRRSINVLLICVSFVIGTPITNDGESDISTLQMRRLAPQYPECLRLW